MGIPSKNADIHRRTGLQFNLDGFTLAEIFLIERDLDIKISVGLGFGVGNVHHHGHFAHTGPIENLHSLRHFFSGTDIAIQKDPGVFVHLAGSCAVTPRALLAGEFFFRTDVLTHDQTQRIDFGSLSSQVTSLIAGGFRAEMVFTLGV